MSDKNERPNSNVSDSNIQGAGIVNIGGEIRARDIKIILNGVSNVINGMSAPQDDKAALQELFTDLMAALNQEGAKSPDDAEKIAKRAKEVIEEAAAPKPDKDGVEAKASLLKKAADNVANVMPVVVGIATNIVASILRLHA